MDEFDALLGMGITDEEELRALAQGLRGKKEAADFFALSTIPTIAKPAQQSRDTALKSAEQAGMLKKAMEAEAAANQRQQNQLDATAEQGRLNRATQLQIARIRNNRALGGDRRAGVDPSKPFGALKTGKERDRFNTIASELANTDFVAESWKPEFGPMVPGVSGPVENWLGKNFPTDDKLGLAEQANWWANFEAFHSMPKRHKFFGSAFTKVEQAAWDKAYFNENATPEIVQNRLRVLQHMARRAAEKMVIDAYEQNVSMDIIENNYGSVIDVEGLIDTWENNREAYKEKRRQDEILAGQFLKSEGESDKSIMDKMTEGARKAWGGESAPAAVGPKPISEMTDEEIMQELARG